MAKEFRVNQLDLGGVKVTASNIVLSSVTGQFAPSGLTGQFITTAQTGIFYPASNPNNYITSAQAGGVSSIKVTGANISGVIVFTGIGGLNVSLSGNTVVFSGGSGSSNVSAAANSYLFNATIASGVSQQFINFPTDLGANPLVLSSLTSNTGSPIIPYQVSGIVSTGFWLTLANGIPDNSYSLNTLVSTTTLTGLVASVTSNTYISNYTGNMGALVNSLIVTGTPLSGNIILSGAAGISVLTGYAGQNIIAISGWDTGQYVTTAMTGQFVDSAHTGGFVSISQTGQFVTTAQTGQYAPSGMTGQFVTTNKTGGFVSISQTGQFIDTSKTGQFAPSGMTGQFVTSDKTGQYVTTAMTGTLVPAGITGNAFYPRFGNPAGYLTSAGGGGGVNTLIVTGVSLSGNITFSGAANISILTGYAGQNIIAISGWDTGQYVTSAMTGQFVTTAQTGIFYPASNPNGYITSAQAGGVSALTVTGASVSGNVNFTGLRGINVSLSGQYILISGGDTGQFITTAQTGQYAPAGMTGQFVTTAQTGQYAPAGMTGQFITTAQTGQFAPSGMTGQFITTSQTGQYAPAGMTGQFVTTDKTGQYAPAGMTGQFVTTANTGIFVARGETGNAFYPRFGNPAGYVTSAVGGGGITGVTGISISGSTPMTGLLTFTGDTGILITVTNDLIDIQINPTNLATLSGIGGTQVITSGSFLLISGGASGPASVDLTTDQTVGGIKTFTSDIKITGADLDINSVGLSTSFIASGNIDNYYQSNVVNTHTGTNASSDVVVSNSSSETSRYVDMGINSTGYTGTSVGWTGDGYVYNLGGDFYVGNTTINRALAMFSTSSMTGNTAYQTGRAQLLIYNNLVLVSGWPVVTMNQTGQFIDTSETGQFAPAGMTGQFVTTNKTGGFVSISQTGQFVDSSETGQFAPAGMTGQFITTAKTGIFLDSSDTGIFNMLSKTASFSNPDGIQSGSYSQAVWRCNREATMTGFYGYRIGGSGAVVNAYKNSTALAHLAVNMNLPSTGTWLFSGTITNASYVKGDTLILSIVSITGLPTAITLQADFA